MNAFTAKEYTCYYARVLDTDLPLAIDVVCDMLTGSLIRAGGRRRRARRHPRRDRDDRGRPGRLRARPVRAHHARRHPARPPGPRHRRHRQRPHRATDRAASTRSTTTRPTWSSPPPATSTTTRSYARSARAFEKAGALERRRRRARSPRATAAAHLRTAGRVELLDRKTEQAHVVLGMPGLARTDERRWALGVLNTALGGGMTSRLFQEVREKRGLAYSVYSYTSGFADCGLFGVYAGCRPRQVARRARRSAATSSTRSPSTASPTRRSAAPSASCPAPRCSAWRTPAR